MITQITLLKSTIVLRSESARWWSSPLFQTLLGGGAAIAGGLGAPLVQGWLDRRRRKVELLARIRAALEQVAATARSTATKDQSHPINPEAMNAVVIESQRYDRISDGIGLLG